jgi:hypothetical protein
MHTTELKTNRHLLEAIAVASKRTLSPEEMRAQRVSFIYGSLSGKSSVTRAHIQDVLNKQEGLVPA